MTGALPRVRRQNELAPARGGRRPLARAHRSGGVPRHPSSAWDRPPTASRTSAGAKLARLVGRRRLLGGAATKLQRAAWHAARRLAPVRGRGRAPRVPGQPARSSERSRAAVCGCGGDLSPRSMSQPGQSIERPELALGEGRVSSPTKTAISAVVGTARAGHRGLRHWSPHFPGRLWGCQGARHRRGCYVERLYGATARC